MPKLPHSIEVLFAQRNPSAIMKNIMSLEKGDLYQPTDEKMFVPQDTEV